MGAPTSKTDICNLAIDLLGQTDLDPITNIDSPKTNSEKICARWYDETRRAVLRRHPWNFAKTRAQLAASATAPLFGFTSAYPLPSDFVRLNVINNPDDADSLIGPDDYSVEDGNILTMTDSTSPLFITYTYDNEDVQKFDTLFVDMLAAELALRIAPRISASNTTVERIKVLLSDMTRNAEAIDGQERPPIRIQRSRLRTARFGRGFGRFATDRWVP